MTIAVFEMILSVLLFIKPVPVSFFKGYCETNVVFVCITHGQVKIISPDTHNPLYVITDRGSELFSHTSTHLHSHNLTCNAVINCDYGCEYLLETSSFYYQYYSMP